MCNCQCHTTEYGAPGTLEAKECCWEEHVRILGLQIDDIKTRWDQAVNASNRAARERDGILVSYKIMDEACVKALNERDAALLQLSEVKVALEQIMNITRNELTASSRCNRIHVIARDLMKTLTPPGRCQNCGGFIGDGNLGPHKCVEKRKQEVPLPRCSHCGGDHLYGPTNCAERGR